MIKLAKPKHCLKAKKGLSFALKHVRLYGPLRAFNIFRCIRYFDQNFGKFIDLRTQPLSLSLSLDLSIGVGSTNTSLSYSSKSIASSVLSFMLILLQWNGRASTWYLSRFPQLYVEALMNIIDITLCKAALARPLLVGITTLVQKIPPFSSNSLLSFVPLRQTPHPSHILPTRHSSFTIVKKKSALH